MEGFLRYNFGGLIFGGAYFRNFTVTRYTFTKTRSRLLLLNLTLLMVNQVNNLSSC